MAARPAKMGHRENSGAPYFAEAAYTYDIPQDWTAKEAKALEFWLNDGDDSNSINELYVAPEDADGDLCRSSLSDWDNWLALYEHENWWGVNVSLQQFNCNDVNLTGIAKVSVGFGDAVSPGGAGTVVFDDIRVYPSRAFERPPADFDGDYAVDFRDFAYFADAWLDNGWWP